MLDPKRNLTVTVYGEDITVNSEILEFADDSIGFFSELSDSLFFGMDLIGRRP